MRKLYIIYLGLAMGAYVIPASLCADSTQKLPRSKRATAPPLSEMPKTFPQWSYRRHKSLPPTLAVGPVRRIPAAVKNLNFFVSDKPLKWEGEIVGTELNTSFATEYQYIYVYIKDLVNEKRFIVFKEIGKITSPFTNGKPVMNQILGSIEISASIDEKQKLFRALVTKTTGHIPLGVKLISGSLPVYSFLTQREITDMPGTIIGGQFNTEQTLFGSESIVFLNRGTSEGLAEGQSLPIYQLKRACLKKDPISKEDPLRIGRLKVVKTDEHSSTAVILESSSFVEVGDGTSPDLEKN